MATVDILLATYNGEKYIAEQIESLQKQTFTDWRLLVSDDGSTDETVSIVKAIQQKESRIELAPDHEPTGSPANNFLYLLEKSTAPYVMFCDQDDVWLPEKIAKTFDAMKAVGSDATLPVAVHTDSIVVDEELRVLLPSFLGTHFHGPEDYTLYKALVSNICQGSTMMLNRPLIKRVLGVRAPKEFPQHDYWAAVVALGEGRLVCLEKPTLLYRQHGGNVVGAQEPLTPFGRMASIVKTVFSVYWVKEMIDSETEYFDRAKALMAADLNLSVEAHAALSEIASSESGNYHLRIKVLEKYRMQKELSLYQRLYQRAGILFHSLKGVNG